MDKNWNKIFLILFTILTFLNAAKVKVTSIDKCESSNNKIILVENCNVDSNGLLNFSYDVIKENNKTYVSQIKNYSKFIENY